MRPRPSGYANRDFLGRELLERLGEHLGGTAYVGLEDDRQFLDFARRHLFVELFSVRRLDFASDASARLPGAVS